MKDFAQIIRLENGEQVVCMRDSDNDNGEHVAIVFKMKGCSVTAKIGVASDALADALFNTAHEWVPKQVASIIEQHGGICVEDEPVEEAPTEPIGDFHAHLDSCAQCHNHPFALCDKGQQLLLTVGS